jgi:hypothetical protein
MGFWIGRFEEIRGLGCRDVGAVLLWAQSVCESPAAKRVGKGAWGCFSDRLTGRGDSRIRRVMQLRIHCDEYRVKEKTELNRIQEKGFGARFQAPESEPVIIVSS